MPAEYLKLVLCRDVFHCTPKELRAQNTADILEAITCLEAEAQVREMEENSRKKS